MTPAWGCSTRRFRAGGEKKTSLRKTDTGISKKAQKKLAGKREVF